MRAVRFATLGFVVGVLASCGGTENRGQSAATGGAGTGGAASSGGVVGNTGGLRAADSGGSGNGGTAASGGSVGHTGGKAGVDASASGGRAVEDAGSAGEGSANDLCALHGAPCCVPAIAEVKPGSGCVIDVFDEYVNAIYEYAALEEKVASLSAGIAVTVTDADVASASAEPPPSRRMEFRLTPEASTRLGPLLEDRTLFPFRLSCGGQELFLGVVYWFEGAAALRTPVLHVERNTDGNVVLLLGAWQSAWMGLGLDGPGNPVLQERIDRPELRAPLCERGILQELDPRQRGWTGMPPRP